MATTRLRERVDDHHGVVAGAVDNDSDPDRFSVPAYLGARDWAEVRALLTEAYRLQAPRKLAALLDQTQAGSSSPR